MSFNLQGKSAVDYKKLKDAIKRSPYTQKEIAKKIGLDPSNLSHKKGRDSLKVQDLEKICEMLEVHPYYFLDFRITRHRKLPKKN